jgi:translation initiation factor RLI1
MPIVFGTSPVGKLDLDLRERLKCARNVLSASPPDGYVLNASHDESVLKVRLLPRPNN